MKKDNHTSDIVDETPTVTLEDSTTELTIEQARATLQLAGKITLEFYHKPFEDDGFIPTDGSKLESYIDMQAQNIYVADIIGTMFSAIYQVSKDTAAIIIEESPQAQMLNEEVRRAIEHGFEIGVRETVGRAYQVLEHNINSLMESLDSLEEQPDAEESADE